MIYLHASESFRQKPIDCISTTLKNILNSRNFTKFKFLWRIFFSHVKPHIEQLIKWVTVFFKFLSQLLQIVTRFSSEISHFLQNVLNNIFFIAESSLSNQNKTPFYTASTPCVPLTVRSNINSETTVAARKIHLILKRS